MAFILQKEVRGFALKVSAAVDCSAWDRLMAFRDQAQGLINDTRQMSTAAWKEGHLRNSDWTFSKVPPRHIRSSNETNELDPSSVVCCGTVAARLTKLSD